MTAKSGPFIAPGYVKTVGSTTEYQLWDTTGGIYFGGVLGTPPSTVAFTIVGTVATQTLTNKTLGTGTVLSAVSETTTANLANSGLSLLTYSTAASNYYTLSAPVAGADKYIAIAPTTLVPDTTGVFVGVYSGSTATFFMTPSTLYTPFLYVGLMPPNGLVHLMGVSTGQWNVVAQTTTFTSVRFSTSTAFSS